MWGTGAATGVTGVRDGADGKGHWAEGRRRGTDVHAAQGDVLPRVVARSTAKTLGQVSDPAPLSTRPSHDHLAHLLKLSHCVPRLHGVGQSLARDL
jgi:hypothetical protein